MSQEKKLMTTGAFAKEVGISTAKVSKLIRDGKIEATKVSGRWRINPSQLKIFSAHKSGQGTTAKIPKSASKATPRARKAGPATSQKSFSIGEFAAMTYLTEKGVLDWLKSGRLTGRIGAKGEWSIEASNLKKADILRLVRE